MRLLFMGFGNAAKAYSRLLLDKSWQIAEEHGYHLVVVGIATGTKGNLESPSGLNLDGILMNLAKNNSFDEFQKHSCPMTGIEMVKNIDYDVLIEMTPLNIQTGQPAIEHIKEALIRGKHVITANKGPIAWNYKQLLELAKQKGAIFLYETTVMDGTPVFNLLRDTLPMCKVTEIKGILNSTTNFILLEMAAGRTFEEALEEGRKRGFVEADPSMDVEGYDAAAKTTALMNVLMNADLKPTDIDRTGIENVSAELLEKAAKNNKVLKLVCRGFYHNGKPKGEVKLKEVDKTDILATANGTTSIVSISTDLMGTVTIIEHNPEIEQTGYGVFSDTIRLIKQLS